MKTNGNNHSEPEKDELLTDEAKQLLEYIRNVPIETDEDLSALAEIYTD